MSWIYMEGNWGELGHGPTYPHTPLTQLTPVTLLLFWKSRYTFVMNRQAAIESLIEFKTPIDLSSEGS